MTTLFDELRWRGLIQDHTPALPQHLAEHPTLTVYAGFDPTAPSLHVGNLLPILTLVRFQRAGCRPLALAGGGTGLIGDPSGKAAERPLLDAETILTNVAAIERLLSRFLDFSGANAAQIVNNLSWLGDLSLLTFLRETGKHFSVNTMLGKESVRRRLETGISYTEFSYMLLQARDYLELYDRHHCTLQIGGSDQWGNITAGIELIRRTRGCATHGLTLPLITKADGTKFGKTEQGAVWLTADRTSPYAFYQFWFNTEDASVLRYLKAFTFLSADDITDLEASLASHPEDRAAQRALASAVTEVVHGAAGLRTALTATDILFGGAAIVDIDAETLLAIFHDAPSAEVATTLFTNDGVSLPDLAVAANVVGSKGEARRLIEGGGLYFNNRRVESVHARVTREQLIGGRYGVLRKGARTYHLIRLSDST
ncbi:MAG: tyrosine--tRNA ligase [Chloracidobacterium sp.]|uniref:Tyrosine--tRNA ligase n=1 Tax=Chloracidobacterium validum TaxID=2821543 RepID=A0ABX8B4L1_9BACT|nr:tyrosine--tRNA ligase [Chloracidobacterium validum]QUW01913.1 tyrosine--tRNA ligase [Chloracidobacterium validum]